MQLQEYINSQRGLASELAKKIGISPSYLSQMASGDAAISPIKSVEIEIATGGAVARQDLRPLDWKQIWPELAQEKVKRRRRSTDIATDTK